MKKRHRKKRHLGEFQQLGFSIRFTVVEGTDEDSFWDMSSLTSLKNPTWLFVGVVAQPMMEC